MSVVPKELHPIELAEPQAGENTGDYVDTGCDASGSPSPTTVFLLSTFASLIVCRRRRYAVLLAIVAVAVPALSPQRAHATT